MGFLDATGVTTLVTKLRERFAPMRHYHSGEDIISGTIDISRIQTASTTIKGVVKLSDSPSAGYSDRAATSYAVRQAWEKSMYGTSSTGATTATKVISCNDYALQSGQIITIQFSAANTYVSGALKLNINDKGAKTIYKDGAATSASNTLLWDAGDVLQFVYDGSYYRFVSCSGLRLYDGTVV